MPYKSKKQCSYAGCRELTNKNYCDAHRKEVSRHYEKYERDPAIKKRYGRKWQLIRGRYIKAHPLCAECERMGRLVSAEEVHHVLPLSKGGTNIDSNLMSLCKKCHSRITATDGGRWGR